MAYKAKPIILMSPSHRISEICTNLKPFEKEWLEKKPPEDQLTYYGSWPDAELVNPIIRL